MEEKGLPGELHLAWTHRIWSEGSVLAQDDRFAIGFVVSAIFCVIFGKLCNGFELYDGGDAFPVALRAIVIVRKLLVHPLLIHSSNF